MTASATLKPEKANGQVSVTFELDASQLGGHDLVAFEVLTQGKATVATHEDLEDEGQTVHVEEPKVPENPTTPRLLPKTGDDTRLGPFVAAMVASAALSLLLALLRRKDVFQTAVLAVSFGLVLLLQPAAWMVIVCGLLLGVLRACLMVRRE